ncbi:unnamed protein product, partial [Brassica oleracea var. botrytis]
YLPLLFFCFGTFIFLQFHFIWNASYVVHGFVLIGENLVVVLRSSEGDFFRGSGRERSAELFEHDEYRGFGATVFLWEVLGFLSYARALLPLFSEKFLELI